MFASSWAMRMEIGFFLTFLKNKRLPYFKKISASSKLKKVRITNVLVNFLSVCPLVLLYVSDSWVETEAMLKFLGFFHHQAAMQITGMTTTCGAGGEWKYTLVVASMEAAVLQPIIEYVRRRHATIA